MLIRFLLDVNDLYWLIIDEKLICNKFWKRDLIMKDLDLWLYVLNVFLF